MSRRASQAHHSGKDAVKFTREYLSILDSVSQSQIPSLYKDLHTPDSEASQLFEGFTKKLNMSQKSRKHWKPKMKSSLLDDVISRNPAFEKRVREKRASRAARKARAKSKKSAEASKTGGKVSSSRVSSMPSRDTASTGGRSTLVAAAA